MEAVNHDPFDVRDEELDDLFAEHEAREQESNADASGFYPIEVHDVHDQMEAERHMESMQRIHRDIQQLENHRQGLIDRADQWFEKQSTSLLKRINWHEESLRGYIAITGKKTVKLINGTIKTRSGSESTVITDEEAFMAWARKHNTELINEKTTYSPAKKAIKDSVSAGGQMPDGVEFVTGEPSFKVDLAGADQ